MAETITVIAFHNPNNGAASPPAAEDWIPSCHVKICRTSRHMTPLRNWILTQCEWMKRLWGDAIQARGAGVWSATCRSALLSIILLLSSTRPPLLYPTNESFHEQNAEGWETERTCKLVREDGIRKLVGEQCYSIGCCRMSSIIALRAQIGNITASIHCPQTQRMVFISNLSLLSGWGSVGVSECVRARECV